MHRQRLLLRHYEAFHILLLLQVAAAIAFTISPAASAVTTQAFRPPLRKASLQK